MEIKILKQLFAEGVIISAEIIPVGDNNKGWIMVIQKASGGAVTVFKSSQKIKKVYKSVQGALSDAKEIGFKEAIVKLN